MPVEGGAMGKGMMRDWQRPGAGRGWGMGGSEGVQEAGVRSGRRKRGGGEREGATERGGKLGGATGRGYGEGQWGGGETEREQWGRGDGKGGRERGALGRGRQGGGKGAKGMGRRRGKRRGDFTDGYMKCLGGHRWAKVIGPINGCKQIECLERQRLWRSLIATST